MIAISIKHNFKDVIKMLDAKVLRQVPFATMNALNKVAAIVQAEVKKDMQLRFDRPTPYIINSVLIRYAKKNNLTAQIYLRDCASGKNPNSPADQIQQQFTGGTRIRTRLEKLLTNAGLISSSEYVAPGSAAKLDSFGNMSRGQIQQIISQLKASFDGGANKSASARSKAAVKKAGYIFWSHGENFARGAWVRNGRSTSPLLLVVKTPSYKQRIKLDPIGQSVINSHFDRLFKIEFDKAVSTAR